MKKLAGYFLIALAGGLFALALGKAFDKKDNTLTGNTDLYKLPVHKANYMLQKEIVTPDFAQAAENSVHAVVHIKTKYQRRTTTYDQYFGWPFSEFFSQPAPRQKPSPITASGSGVIISDDGYVVTNNHVVQDADEIEVTLNDRRTYSAVIIGTDPSTDLALLKIDEKELPYIPFANSDELKIGEWVLAVGNPFNLTSTVTAGIVSAKARNINILGSNTAVESFIQTDAAVNRGNSGGALVNTKGELVGVNAAIASNTGSYTGYSFAIPANLVKKVMDDLLEYGEVQRAFLGVSITTLNSKLADEKGIEDLTGVYVAGITDNGGAEKAGVKEGDVITHVNGIAVNTESELIEQVAQYRPGDKVSVIVKRDNKEKVFKVELKNKDGNTKIVKKDEKNIVSLLGADFEEISGDDQKRLNIANGLRVKKLEGGKLRSAGIREGFIITSIDKKTIRTTEDLKNALSNKKGGVLIEGIYPNGMKAYYGFGL